MDTLLLEELLAMKRHDEEVRARLLNERRLYGVYDQEMQQVHTKHAHRLFEIVAQHGWPGISLVGIEGCRAAWFIAQHAVCTPNEQRSFLNSLNKAVEAGDAPKRLAAFLTDRIRYNEQKPQVYGTVLDWDETRQLSCEIEDLDGLDRRRAEVGLPPFDEDLVKHRIEVEEEGGTPPADMTEYQNRKLEWARSVGWV